MNLDRLMHLAGQVKNLKESRSPRNSEGDQMRSFIAMMKEGYETKVSSALMNEINNWFMSENIQIPDDIEFWLDLSSIDIGWTSDHAIEKGWQAILKSNYPHLLRSLDRDQQDELKSLVERGMDNRHDEKFVIKLDTEGQ